MFLEKYRTHFEKSRTFFTKDFKLPVPLGHKLLLLIYFLYSIFTLQQSLIFLISFRK